MKQLTLSVKKREQTGSGSAGRLRKAGLIPAIMYGKSGNTNLAVEESKLRTLLRALKGAAAIIELDAGDSKSLTVLKDLDRNSITDKFEHVDFHEVAADDVITVKVALHTTGECEGVKTDKGNLDTVLHELTLRCKPANLPEFIELDVTNLRAGESLHVSDVTLPEGVEPAPNTSGLVVVAVTGGTAAGKQAEATEEAPAEAAAAE